MQVNKNMVDQNNLLDNVNDDLVRLIDMATGDFIVVNKLVARYRNNIQLKGIADSDSISMRIESLVCHLQHVDVFKQRVEHLILVHRHMLDNMHAVNFNEPFFHLHVFQAMTIEFDLLGTIAEISALLGDLKDQLILTDHAIWSKGSFFNNAAEINDVLRKMIFRFRAAGGDVSSLPLPPLSEKQVNYLNSLYTMERERLVLSWYLEAMPHGTWADLSQHYTHMIYQGSKEGTELF